jgi:multisubunit Na+/H+ antiporter MnhB subunit
MSRQGSEEMTTDPVSSPMRLVALTLCVVSPVMVVLSLTSDGNAFQNSWWIVAFVGWLVLWGLLRSMTRGVAERPSTGLDERERGLRDRVSFIGFQCAVAAGMVVVLLMVVFQNQPEMIERMPALLASLMLTSSALPSIILGFSGATVDDAEA